MSDYVLRHAETKAEIAPGSNITHRETRQVWQFEKVITIGENSRLSGRYMLRVSRYDHRMRTRVSTLFHPHLFLCEIEVTAEISGHTVSFRQTWGITKEQLFIPLWLGFAAWLVLAVADKLHLEDLLFGWIH